MKKYWLLSWVITCIVIGFVSFIGVLGVGMIQHYMHIKSQETFWNEHGFPFTFYYETTFNEDALEGTYINGFLLDFLIYFLFFSLVYIGYKWITTKKGPR